jgi:hypothetical protein
MKKYNVKELIGEGKTVDVGKNICIPKSILKSTPKKVKAGYHEFKYDGIEGKNKCYKRIK